MRPIAQHSRSTRIVARGAHGPIDYTRLVFAAGTGWLFFAEPLSITTAIGTAIIAGSTLMLTRGARVDGQAAGR